MNGSQKNKKLMKFCRRDYGQEKWLCVEKVNNNRKGKKKHNGTKNPSEFNLINSFIHERKKDYLLVDSRFLVEGFLLFCFEWNWGEFEWRLEN